MSAWTLSDLRRANIERQAEWCPDQVPDLSFRGNELAGETGEACNVIKKLERERHGWRGSRATAEHLAAELADVVICADLAAMAAGVDLYEAVSAKFDATSMSNGLSTRLRAALTAASERDGWRPIDTAPKDGTSILLGHRHAAFDGYWSDEAGGWVNGQTNRYDELLTYEPTHWQPLPTPPAPDVGREG